MSSTSSTWGELYLLHLELGQLCLGVGSMSSESRAGEWRLESQHTTFTGHCSPVRILNPSDVRKAKA